MIEKAGAGCNNLDEAVDVDRGSEIDNCLLEIFLIKFSINNGVGIQCDAH